jgi:DNA-binding GntR family transcriptional regulator
MTKTEQTYNIIKKIILQNGILPGERLYLNDLSKKLSVSSTPLREAMNRLVQDGYFCHTSNRGYVLRIITTREFEELYEYCMALETYAIGRAISNITSSALAELHDNIEIYRSLTDRRERFIVNNQFHLKITSLSGNGVILKSLSGVLEKIILKWKVENLVHSRGSLPFDEHMAIYSSLEEKNEGEAVRNMHNHIRNTKNSVLRELKMKENLFLNTINPLTQVSNDTSK